MNDQGDSTPQPLAKISEVVPHDIRFKHMFIGRPTLRNIIHVPETRFGDASYSFARKHCADMDLQEALGHYMESLGESFWGHDQPFEIYYWDYYASNDGHYMKFDESTGRGTHGLTNPEDFERNGNPATFLFLFHPDREIVFPHEPFIVRNALREIFPVNSNLKWRLPQQEALLKLRHILLPARNGSMFMVVLPTATGKTLVIQMSPFMMDAKRVLVVTPSVTLKDQLVRECDDAYKPDRPIGRCVHQYTQITPRVDGYVPGMVAGNRHFVVANIHPFMDGRGRGKGYDLRSWLLEAWDEPRGVWQPPESEPNCHNVDNCHMLSMSQAWLKDWSPDLIIVDEAHHMPADSWMDLKRTVGDVMGSKTWKMLLLTGTPRREDDRPYGLSSEDFYYLYPRKEAVAAKYIKATKTEAIEVGAKPKQQKPKNSEADAEDKFGRIDNSQQDDADVTQLLDSEFLSTMFTPAVAKLCDMKKSCNGLPLKMLVTVGNIKDAEHVATWFNEQSPKHKWGLKAAAIHSKNNNDASMNDFGDEAALDSPSSKIDVGIQVQQLAEGYDNKWIVVTLFLTNIHSVNKLAQIHGRALRRIKLPSSHPRQTDALSTVLETAHLFYPDWPEISTTVQQYLDGVDEQPASLLEPIIPEQQQRPSNKRRRSMAKGTHVDTEPQGTNDEAGPSSLP